MTFLLISHFNELLGLFFHPAENWLPKKGEEVKGRLPAGSNMATVRLDQKRGRWSAACLRRSRRHSHGTLAAVQPMLNSHANNSKRTLTPWKTTASAFTALTPMKTIPIACSSKTKPSWLTVTCCCPRPDILHVLLNNRPLLTFSWRPEGVQTCTMGGEARMDGGDIIRLGDLFFVGRSSRTNDLGIASLAGLLDFFGMNSE